MNPYSNYADLLFTCVGGPITDVIETVLNRFNTMEARYHVRNVDLDLSLAYVNHGERDHRIAQRILFWEPSLNPGNTVFVGNYDDGMAHSVFRLSEYSTYQWINVRIYEDNQYPGCFFSFYADERRIERVLYASKDDGGWQFLEQGPVQHFENPHYYSARAIRDRLTKAIITEYLEKLGFSINRVEFWQTSTQAELLWEQR